MEDRLGRGTERDRDEVPELEITERRVVQDVDGLYDEGDLGRV